MTEAGYFDAAAYEDDFTQDAHAAYRSTFVPGGSFIFDVPDDVPAVWGVGQAVLWAEGEALMVCGGNGVGKTTTMGQLVRARIFGGDVLGFPVAPLAPGEKVLYLAMDRPAQISRSMARQFRGLDRRVVDERLVVRKGPPPADLAKNPHVLRDMCRAAGATTVFVDSLKDAAIGLSEDAVGAGYNQARQMAIADGVQVCEGHHQVKKGGNGEAPTSIEHVFGSVWLTGGAGSVVLLHGKPGDPIVDFRHLKQPTDEVGPFKIVHDEHGTSRVWQQADPIVLIAASQGRGIVARDLAVATHERDKVTPAEIEKARRRLERLVRDGILGTREIAGSASGVTTKVYVLADTPHAPHGRPHAPLFAVGAHAGGEEV